MRINKLYSVLILSFLFTISFQLKSQHKLQVSEASTMQISGTSSLHDWESVISSFIITGFANVTDNKITSITSLSLTIPVTAIKSGKNLMDEKTYKALKYKKYPQIVFELVSVKLSEGKITGKGKLTIAGEEKTIPINATYQQNNNNSILVNGNNAIDMTDYRVEPPTALMGSIETGKEVNVVYAITIKY